MRESEASNFDTKGNWLVIVTSDKLGWKGNRVAFFDFRFDNKGFFVFVFAENQRENVKVMLEKKTIKIRKIKLIRMRKIK